MYDETDKARERICVWWAMLSLKEEEVSLDSLILCVYIIAFPVCMYLLKGKLNVDSENIYNAFFLYMALCSYFFNVLLSKTQTQRERERSKRVALQGFLPTTNDCSSSRVTGSI